jgi:Tfp pilus assembly protein PilF
MAQLSFLLLPERAGDEKSLDAAYQNYAIQMMVRYDENAVNENPNDANARLKLGKMRLAQRKTEDAKIEIEQAVQLDPNLPEAHYFAGLIARLQKRLPDAEHEFEIAARLEPSDGKTWGNLGLVRIDLGDLKSARECFQRALEIDPTDKISRAMLDQIPK